MTTDIKELAQWLRAHGQSLKDAMGLKNVPFRLTSAADALEAMAGEVERLKEERDAARDDEELMSKAKQLCEAERDRLKAALVRLGTHINISAGERLMIVQETLGGDA